MARKPESNFIARVHRQLPESIYREKTHNIYRGGTPDVYYEGNSGILWAEYKWYDSVPPKIELIDKKLSRLQLQWLDRCHKNGTNCVVIVGCKEGGVIYTEGQWSQVFPRSKFLRAVMSPQAIAQRITEQLTR